MAEIEGKNEVCLQVLICAYGMEGIRRVADGKHPAVPGVEYLVSWQVSETPVIPKELERDDFKVFITDTKGLSVNRNIALSKASAPLLLISDDDADYTEDQLQTVMSAFKNHPDADLIAFRYASVNSHKSYPAASFSLSCPPKGYFTSSIELAFRKDAVKDRIWFNENFGIGATFPAGEENLFINDCLEAGLKGIYVPEYIVRHDAPTTSGRNLRSAERPQTKGAIFLHMNPRTWPLRMLAHAVREIPMWRKGLVPSPLSYCRNWIKGAAMARKNHVFPTPDYSQKYPCHD